MERCGFRLRNLLRFAVAFRGGRLVNARFPSQSQNAYRLQDAQRTQCVNIPRVFWHVERELDMALCRKIVDFIRLHLGNHPCQ